MNPIQLPTEALQQWRDLQELMQQGKHAPAIQEAGTLLQTLLRKIILQYTPELPYRNRSSIFQLEQELGKGAKGIEGFELGPLIQILVAKEVDFIRCAAHILKKDAEILKSINFGYLQGVRNKHAHYSATALRTAAQYFISSVEILLSFFEIDVLNYAGLLTQIEQLNHENEALKSEIGSVEEINGVMPFYRRYAEIASTMDFLDTCYYAQHHQFTISAPPFKELYEKVHYSNSESRMTRIVVNLHNPQPLPFLLFYRFVKDIELFREGKTEYRGFHAFSDDGNFVQLPHFILLYSRNELDNGVVILSSFDQARYQKNIFFKSKKVFGFFFDAYQMLFRCCKKLEIEELKHLYVKAYGPPSNVTDIENNIDNFYRPLSTAVAERDKAIGLWKAIFNL